MNPPEFDLRGAAAPGADVDAACSAPSFPPTSKPLNASTVVSDAESMPDGAMMGAIKGFAGPTWVVLLVAWYLETGEVKGRWMCWMCACEQRGDEYVGGGM